MTNSSTILLISALLVPTLALPQEASRASTDASSNASQLVGVVVAGYGLLLVVGGYLTVHAIEKTGESVVIVLRDSSESVKVAVKGTREVIEGELPAVGQTVQVSVEASGTALIAAGKVIAFIPNEVGKSLLHRSAVSSLGYSK